MIRQDAAFTCRYRAPGSAPQGPIRYAIGQTTLGMVLAGKTSLASARFCWARTGTLRAELATAFPDATLQADPRSLQPELAAIAAYIDHGNADAPLALDVGGTAFQQQVWQALAAIPAGQTRSYGELARQLGAPDASRAVAGACAANVLAVAIPAIAWCGAMARYPAIAGASNASARCSPASAADDAGNLRHGAGPDRHDWEAIARALDARGNARLPGLLDPRNARLWLPDTLRRTAIAAVS